MKKTTFISIISVLIIYEIISLILNKNYLIPDIFEVLVSLKNIVFSKDFIIIIFSTIIRALIGLTISFILALLLAFISFKNEKFKELFQPVYVISKTIPNITYIIVSLIWFGRNASTIIVSMLVVFPILYNSFLSALLNIDKSLLNVTKIFPGTFLQKAKRIYFPLIKKDVLTALNNACSLGFKVSIMAEILSQVKTGIGKELYYAKINFLVSDIFAWTIVIIIISYLFDVLFKKIIDKE